MNQKKPIIIFSHGFGVAKDDRGLFSDITNALSDAECVLFDYNEIDEEKNTMTVRSLPEQANILEDIIKRKKRENPDVPIYLICHSQGCLVAALANLGKIEKAIFLAPSLDVDIERMVNMFKDRPGTEINMEGISKLARKDGSTTIVPPEYWTTRREGEPKPLYNKLAEETELTIIIATQDDILGHQDISGLNPKIKILKIDAKHNFEDEARKELVDRLIEILSF